MATISRPVIWHEPLFNPDANFRVIRPLRLEGRDFKPGEAFDKTKVTTRTLRLLHDARKLEMIEPAGSLAVRHIGRGRFAVFSGNERITEPMSRTEAEAELAR